MRQRILDYHPQDSRIGFKADDICQTLASNMGMGGNNVPVILEEDDDIHSELGRET